jgi:hypothetical protein
MTSFFLLYLTLWKIFHTTYANSGENSPLLKVQIFIIPVNEN